LGYVVAAYAVVIGSVLAYWVFVQRERRRIARELDLLSRESGSLGARE
jgi:hypothetical protein